jgi:hypothetical protein
MGGVLKGEKRRYLFMGPVADQPFVLTTLMLKIKGDPRGYAPWSQGENSEPEKGRQGAERPLEGVFPSKNTPQSADSQCSLRAPRSAPPIKR